MAFTVIRQNEDGVPVYTCLSSDTKESPKPVGAIALETDTGDKYEYLGSAGWIKTHKAGKVIVNNAKIIASSTGNTVTTTLASIIEFATEDLGTLGFELDVATAALTDLEIYVQFNADGNFVDLATSTNWATEGHPINFSDITNTGAVAVGSHVVELNVSGYYAVQIWGQSGTTSTVGIYPGGFNG